MAALTALNGPARILGIGMPGSGKTGSLAVLANAGFKLRILAYDKESNITMLRNYVKPGADIDVLLLEDKLRLTPAGLLPDGTPTAYNDGIKALIEWPGHGASKNWGLDTIVVLDSLTAMGDASYNRAYKMAPQTKNGFVNTRKVYGVAQQELLHFLDVLMSSRAQHHVIVFAHMMMVGPKDVEKDEADITKQIKEETAELIKTRWYPRTPGRAIADRIGGAFGSTILYETVEKAGKPKRVINVAPRMDIDLKLPAINFPADLPAENGLRDVFEAITPGIEACLAGGKVLASPEGEPK